MKTVFRTDGKDRSYTCLSNKLLQNKALSWETRGMLADILSRHDDWDITPAGLAAMGDCGRDRVYRMIREAKAAGFMRMDEKHGARGERLECTYIVSDDPEHLKNVAHTYNLNPENPNLGKADLGASLILNPENPNLVYPDRAFPTQQSKDLNKVKIETNSAQIAQGVLLPDVEAPPLKHLGRSIHFDEFWRAFPLKKGKARAQKIWSGLSDATRRKAIDGIEPYSGSESVRRGFIQQGDTYLSKRTWEDYELDQGEAEEAQVTAIALDLAEGSPKFILKYGWKTLDEVQRKAVTLFRRGVQKAREEFQWTPPASFAANAA